MRVAVIGHVEHVTIGRVAEVPVRGEILHLLAPRAFAGGGGGVAAFQLAKSAHELHVFTAFGADDAGRFVARELAATGAVVHAVQRSEPHTRDVVMVTDDAQRTIVVVGAPLHPRRDDALPWELLATCDAVYFTATDPAALVAARAARMLVVTARRREAIVASGIRPDVIVGSSSDPREASTFADWPIVPQTLVMTDGARGGVVEDATGSRRWEPTPPPARIVGSYGAGDSFAGALTHFLGAGLEPLAAATRAAPYGAAVLAHLVPLDGQLILADA